MYKSFFQANNIHLFYYLIMFTFSLFKRFFPIILENNLNASLRNMSSLNRKKMIVNSLDNRVNLSFDYCNNTYNINKTVNFSRNETECMDILLERMSFRISIA